MNWSLRRVLALVLLVGFSQVVSAQVTAEWSLIHVQYTPSMSNADGMTVTFEFHITSGSGYVDLLGTLGKGLSIVTGGTTQTTKMWVEEGGDYEVGMVLEFWGNRKTTSSLTNCFDVTFDSSAFPNARKHTIKALQGSTGISWCPQIAQRVGQDEDAFQLNASDGEFADHVRVTWNEIESANTYRVFRCLDEDVSSCGALIGQSNDNGFDDMEGMDETIYWYRVKSCSPSGCSDFSPADTGHRSESSGQPASPTGVNATDGTITGRVRVTWNAVDGAVNYWIYRCKSSDGSCGQIGATGATSIYDTPPAAGTTYWYRVTAWTENFKASARSEADTGYSRAPLPNGACDEAFVQIDNSSMVINVAPTGIDDTVNIQCALDTAASDGYPTVRLGRDSYYISNLLVEGFKGSFEGTAQAATLLEVIDGSLDCSLMRLRGRVSAAIKFVNGEPRIRYMTIRANMSCLSSKRYLTSILHFTGESTKAENCDNDVIFAAVDRVIIDGTSIDDGPRVAVSVDPEGQWHWKGGCKDTLLGTFKLNRSTILNTRAGLRTSMKSGAQVDINFNEFRGNLEAVTLADTNQNTTITANKFFGDSTLDDWYFGILVTNFSDDPPPSSRLVVHNNEFNVASSFDESGSIAVCVSFNLGGSGSGVISRIDSIISNNKFNLSDDGAYGVLYYDTSNTHVSGNRFSGSGARAIMVAGDAEVSGWDITANTGLENFSSFYEEDIRFFSNTSNCIVGPGQGASILDDGTDNTILPQ